MPAEDRLGLDDCDAPAPTRQQSRGDEQSEPIETRDPWTACPSAENDDLVAEDGVLQE